MSAFSSKAAVTYLPEKLKAASRLEAKTSIQTPLWLPRYRDGDEGRITGQG